MSMQTLPAAVQALTYRQLVDLFRILGGGTVGFDYSKYKLADLRVILADWIYVRGAFTADYVESVADTVAAAVHAPVLPQPSLPSPPLPLPSRPAPVAGTPEPFSAPRTVAAAADTNTADSRSRPAAAPAAATAANRAAAAPAAVRCICAAPVPAKRPTARSTAAPVRSRNLSVRRPCVRGVP